ncbi:hypothetical protein QA612_17510 [Evansella sp. AB-P1]|uniref:hypothetical protein n=1 Tax=Evansella sp. AB-P1 TaxID=3037653 RepID=UPI00241EA661|nr:hypothetical protein [Evansella sp. AB-P1]MDG5789260.1 hypothetical protein [Evansella sp. AB-P1]
MKKLEFKVEYIPGIIAFLVTIVLFTGIMFQLFSQTDILTFSLIIGFLVVLTIDIKKGNFKKKEKTIPIRYGTMIGLFCLLTFL